jgi:carboxymethylenebutenolidase
MRRLCPILLLLISPVSAGEAEILRFPIGKDTVQAWLFRADGKGSFPAVVIVHGDFGPTAWVKEQASRLAKKGYVTLVVDLYRGNLPKSPEEAHILERGLAEDRVLRDLAAAVDVLQKRPEVEQRKIAILGFDMGGGHALDFAITDRRVRAVVTCYGRLNTDADHLAKLQGPLLGLFAGKDEGITSETLARFQKAMQRAGKRALIHVYANAENGFLDPQSPYLSAPPAAADVADAWQRIERFLAAELK